jgi:hypothetical protein
MRRRARPLLFVSLGLLLLSLTACGKDAAPLRDDPNPVYERAMRAVHAADWAALQKELTPGARQMLRRDLARLSARLAHPDDGKREREIAGARLGEEAEGAIAQATSGDPADALAFFVRISPRDPIPPRRSFKLERFKAEMLYALSDGTQRGVTLVRLPDGWYVRELQL